MGTTLSQRLSRISTLLIAAVGVAFAWFLLTLMIGFTSGQAHADDDSLLGAVGSTLESSTAAVTDTAGDLLGGVTDAAGAVVAPVAAVVEPVAPVAPVVETVQQVAEPVVVSVAEIAESGVVSGVADVAVDLVTAVPVVGDVAASVGADDALTSVGTAADGVLQGATGAVTDTVTAPLIPPHTAAPAPAAPSVAAPVDSDPVTPGILASSATDAAAAAPASRLVPTGVGVGSPLTSAAAAPLQGSASAVVTATAFGAALGGLTTLLGAVLQADSVLSGPGGAGPGAWVLVALGFVVAYRAWVRRTGIENDTAPLAPAFATDVSPD